mmetsp:Transcript_3077/g.11075  ORF Transcript_3077/g.11075 Transcript_3077/m.11075 type:complete len:90 (+) Transcript_3077:549-818(+)
MPSMEPGTPVRCKPQVEAFKHACKLANVEPEHTCFFDDSARNVKGAKAAGIKVVVHVRGAETPADVPPAEGADFTVARFEDTPAALGLL